MSLLQTLPFGKRFLLCHTLADFGQSPHGGTPRAVLERGPYGGTLWAVLKRGPHRGTPRAVLKCVYSERQRPQSCPHMS